MTKYYNKDGKPITLAEWAQLVEGPRYARVALDSVVTSTGTIEISTVWLGLDRRAGNGPPLIFETMVFGGVHTDQRSYSTLEEALAGHAEVLKHYLDRGDHDDELPVSRSS